MIDYYYEGEYDFTEGQENEIHDMALKCLKIYRDAYKKGYIDYHKKKNSEMFVPDSVEEEANDLAQTESAGFMRGFWSGYRFGYNTGMTCGSKSGARKVIAALYKEKIISLDDAVEKSGMSEKEFLKYYDFYEKSRENDDT